MTSLWRCRWAHSRTGQDSGHQMHFDLDERSLLERGVVRHPAVSCVLYLDAGGGAPTLVTNESIATSTQPNDGGAHAAEIWASEGWQCTPLENRLLMFDGSLLHGVVPAAGTSGPRTDDAGHSSQNRVTLMFGWWLKDNLPCRSDAPARAGATYTNLQANMAMPVASARPSASRRSKRRRVSTSTCTPQVPSPNWQEYFADVLDAARSAKPSAPGSSVGLRTSGTCTPATGDMLVHCPSVWTKVSAARRRLHAKTGTRIVLLYPSVASSAGRCGEVCKSDRFNTCGLSRGEW
eukprot:m.837139 g.837139  ORF g.837139 m.837139 type:complete len:292 (+) comp23460_c0_seq21:1062-1937(+)